ncbi:unnamed protein product [Agarophyton chilense]
MAAPANAQNQSDLLTCSINDLHRVFDLFDLTKDKRMDLRELRQVVRLTSQNPPDTDTILHYLRQALRLAPDDPPPTSIDFNQFLDFFAVYNLDMGDVHNDEIFQVLDEDESGTISAAELAKVMNVFGVTITMDEALAMTDVADEFNPAPAVLRKNHIDRTDFLNIMKRLQQFEEDRSVTE